MRPPAPSPTSAMGRRRVLGVLLLAVILATGLLSGCARVRAALAVQPDDTVTGEIVVATPPTSPTDKGPSITLPPGLADRVTVTAYQQDNYTGSVLRFSRLSFEQVAALTTAAGTRGKQATFQIRRLGGRVLVSGAVDLTTVSVDRADFQLKMSFPGDVVDANGDIDDTTVSWVFTPGEVGDFSAVVAYADPNAPSPLNWTLLLAGVVVVAAGTVVLVARRTRNPPVSPPIR
ncbi:LppM family (lipo)protein [Pseudonocardia sp. CA-107938]|uniref:LppM family (lipo)protein n=1 Tax=Pseudonocardia sp. CA-107938 TaxID=3240021 RepID=UPI003D909B57